MGIEDKRRHLRVRVAMPAEIYDVLNDKTLVGRIIDISAGGIALVTREELPVHTPLSLSFEFENIKYRHIAADVVREIKKGKENYLGIAFFNPDMEEQEQIDSLVRRVRSRKERGLQKGHI
ncbi:MAG: PilZ domain-containing protein [Candidatus Firestonebacteria bacterium]